MKIRDRVKKLISGLIKGLVNAAAYIKGGFRKVFLFFKQLLQRMKTMKTKYLILGVLIVLVLAVGAYAGITFWQISDLESILLDTDFSKEVAYSVDEEFPNKYVNIAVLGFDRNAEREQYAYLFLPDFLAVLTINFETNDIALVRVLRDSYVPIIVPGLTGVKDKINHSYYYGYTYGTGPDRDANGLQCVLDTLSNVLGGIPIHYYVSVNMDGLAYLVDAVGGVEHRVKENLYDKTGKRVLKKGVHHFDGEAFVLYVRHRDDNTGQDVGRVARQFDILEDLFENVRDKGLLKNVPKLFKVYRDYVDTNLTMKQVAALAYYAMDLDPTDDMFHSLTGTSQTKDGIWYWVLNQAQRVQLIKEVFGITAELWPQEVLTDTPPPAVASFEYDLDVDSKGRPVVELSWVPGDDKKVRYELYRDGELILETDADNPITEYRDTDVDEGDTYEYTLRVFHYRAEGPSASLTVRISGPVVPNVAGMTEADARKAIEKAGFVFGTVIEGGYHETLEAGLVIYTEPAAGTEAKRGTIVNIVVSKGLKVTVPNVVGMDESEAKSRINNTPGLSVGEVTYEHNKDFAAGKVISQSLSGKVDPGSQVNLVVSLGAPPVSKVKVPKVVGLTENDAKNELAKVGLGCNVTTSTSDTVPAGTVISQAPGEGVEVDSGFIVQIVVSSGPPS